MPLRTASLASELFGRTLILSGVGYLGSAYAISRFLTRRARGVAGTPADVGLAAENLELTTDDGLTLAGWCVEPAGEVRATVVLFHGLRRSRGQTVGRIAELVRAGYRCIAFDFRAHGASTGKRTSFGYHEAHDVVAIANFVRERWPGRVAALGISMGAAAVCYAAAQTPRWDAVILESVHPDIRTAFLSRIGSEYPAWLAKLEPGLVWVTERRLGLKWQQLAPLRHVAELGPVPLLLTTGTADATSTPEQIEQFRANAAGPTDVWLVEGAGHRDLFEKAGPTWAERVTGFLGATVGLESMA